MLMDQRGLVAGAQFGVEIGILVAYIVLKNSVVPAVFIKFPMFV